MLIATETDACGLDFLIVYTLSGRTGSALVWHPEGRTIEADSVQQVL